MKAGAEFLTWHGKALWIMEVMDARSAIRQRLILELLKISKLQPHCNVSVVLLVLFFLRVFRF